MKPEDVQAIIADVAHRKKIDLSFLMAIASIESNFDPLAESPTGALGLFQITTIALQHYNDVHRTEFNKLDLLDPFLNAEVASWLLQWIARQLGVSLQNISPEDRARVYAAYNVGLRTLRRLEAGNYDAASRLISLQAANLRRGGPRDYLTNVQREINRRIV